MNLLTTMLRKYLISWLVYYVTWLQIFANTALRYEKNWVLMHFYLTASKNSISFVLEVQWRALIKVNKARVWCCWAFRYVLSWSLFSVCRAPTAAPGGPQGPMRGRWEGCVQSICCYNSLNFISLWTHSWPLMTHSPPLSLQRDLSMLIVHSDPSRQSLV